MYTNSFCNWSVNHWKLWLKNPVSVKVWLVATGKEKIALKKFLHFMEATNKGVIFRVIYVKDGHFLVLLSCTAMCSGNLSLMKLQVRWFCKLTYLATIMLSKSCTPV